MNHKAQLQDLRRTFIKGDILMTEGEDSDGFFILEGGVVDIYVNSKKSGSVAAQSGPEFLGEIGALLNVKRTATVVAATPCNALFVPNANFETLISKAPSLGVKLAQSLSRKVASLDEQLKALQK